MQISELYSTQDTKATTCIDIELFTTDQSILPLMLDILRAAQMHLDANIKPCTNTIPRNMPYVLDINWKKINIVIRSNGTIPFSAITNFCKELND